jgi:hypothetical protein
MIELENFGKERTKEVENNDAWILLLRLYNELTRAKNDLEEALLDAHTSQALRRRVREIQTGLVSTLRAFAQFVESDQDHAEEQDHA